MMIGNPTRNNPANRGGLSLVEVSISTLLVGLLVVASLQSVGNVGRTWTTANQVLDGQGLAQDLIREVLAQNYTDPSGTNGNTLGPEIGETTRLQFDDIDDYLAWAEAPPKDAAGTPLTGYTGWSRSVTVEKINPSNYTALNANAADQNLRRITVTATSPAGHTTTLQTYVSRHGGTIQPLSANATLVTWVGCTLQVGSNAPTTTGIAISNHAEDR